MVLKKSTGKLLPPKMFRAADITPSILYTHRLLIIYAKSTAALKISAQPKRKMTLKLASWKVQTRWKKYLCSHISHKCVAPNQREVMSSGDNSPVETDDDKLQALPKWECQPKNKSFCLSLGQRQPEIKSWLNTQCQRCSSATSCTYQFKSTLTLMVFFLALSCSDSTLFVYYCLLEWTPVARAWFMMLQGNVIVVPKEFKSQIHSKTTDKLVFKQHLWLPFRNVSNI